MSLQFDEGSFKDPAGRVFYHSGEVYRSLSPTGAESFQELSRTELFAELRSLGLVVESELVDRQAAALPAEAGNWVVRQARVPVVTYPFEWSFDMLRDAALVTLDVLERCLKKGYVLKDATPFNILFHRNRPVLIDVLSIEKRAEGEPWAGYAQFCRGFLFPLLITSHRKIDFQPLLRSHLGEIPLSTMRGMFSYWSSLKPGVLKDVLLQSQLDRGFATQPQAIRQGTSSFLFSTEMILANVRRLRKIIQSLEYQEGLTTWGNYTQFHNYSGEDEAAKRDFVAKAMESRVGATCVDLGCNTGAYSEIAYQSCASVISIDIDPEAINRMYLGTRDRGENRSLLITDLANPTPAMGWALRERKPLFDRIQGDFFLALALIHHLRITASIPLASIVEQLAAIAPEGVVEWVDKKDGMVQRMLTLRKDVYEDYTWENFRALLESRFQVVQVTETHGGDRKLCHVRH
jgi:hypothetical protein